jgi:hypothetical protein
VNDDLIYVTESGETLESVAQDYLSFLNLDAKDPSLIKRFLENNPLHFKYNTSLPPGEILLLSRNALSLADLATFQSERSSIKNNLSSINPEVKELMKNGFNVAPLFDEFTKVSKEHGFELNLKSLTRGISYASGGTSGYVTTGANSLSNIKNISKVLFDDIVKKFGKKEILNPSPLMRTRINDFIKFHPSNSRLHQMLTELPKHLRQRIAPPNFPNKLNLNSFKRNIYWPIRKTDKIRPSGMINKLGNNLKYLKKVGTGATYAIPAAIGVYNVFEASSSERPHIMAKETLGIVAGAKGTGWGMAAGGTIVAFIGISTGGFIIVGLCAAAAGIAGYEMTGLGYDSIREWLK